jgi:hypothetical protein
MTAVYAPLQNADPTRRGAVTNAAQEIAGLKKFLDGLESAQLVVANDYDPEPLTIEGDPFTANGMPFSLGGPTVADDPFWGVRAQAIDSGGPAGIVEEFAVGRFPGNGPLDLLGPDYLGQGVLPGLSFGVNAFLNQAALLADEVVLGLNARAMGRRWTLMRAGRSSECRSISRTLTPSSSRPTSPFVSQTASTS